MGFSRQEYWSGLPCCPPGDLPDPGIEPMSLTSAALASWFFSSTAWEAQWDREDTDYTHILGSGVGSDKSRISGAPEEAEALDML